MTLYPCDLFFYKNILINGLKTERLFVLLPFSFYFELV
jgi:hypothetical protein